MHTGGLTTILATDYRNNQDKKNKMDGMLEK